jgi:hypothetical protein
MEPNFTVNPDHLLAIIGAKEVELVMLRARLADTEKKLVAEAKDKEQK